MDKQTLLFIPELKGNPRYALNSTFHDFGIISNIIEHEPLKIGGFYRYQYQIGGCRYSELFLLIFEIENGLVLIDSLDDFTRKLYMVNARS